jgi:hypothetical protein
MELEAGYDDMQMGLQARVIAKGMRKIVGIIGQSRATVLCLNQIKEKIGVSFGDPRFTPGGKAIPFHASVRLRLTGETKVKNSEGVVIGIHTHAEVIKNKVAPPWRKAEFDLHFGRGIVEDEALLHTMRQACIGKDKKPRTIASHDFRYSITGAGAWKLFTVATVDGEVLVEKKFTKGMFSKMLKSDEFGNHLANMIEGVMVVILKPDDESSEDPDEETDDAVDEEKE